MFFFSFQLFQIQDDLGAKQCHLSPPNFESKWFWL